jgi:hypothetical protein
MSQIQPKGRGQECHRRGGNIYGKTFAVKIAMRTEVMIITIVTIVRIVNHPYHIRGEVIRPIIKLRVWGQITPLSIL